MEPDQIDMMNEDELRNELRKLIARPSSCTVDSIVRTVAEWNPENPAGRIGEVVMYHGVPHRVIDAGVQGSRLAALREPNVWRTLHHIRDLALENAKSPQDGWAQIAEWCNIHIPNAKVDAPSGARSAE